MKKNFIFLFSLILLGCSHPPRPNHIYYIIHPIPTDIGPDGKKTIPMHYGNYNFILFDNSKIYYHYYNILFTLCGVGGDHSKPPFLDLTPDSLQEIKIQDLENFLVSNVKGSKMNGRDPIAVVSSPVDTIRNPAFDIILKYLDENFNLYGVRTCTEEEKYVSIAKNSNKKYDPKSIEWKIGFDIVRFEAPINTSTN